MKERDPIGDTNGDRFVEENESDCSVEIRLAAIVETNEGVLSGGKGPKHNFLVEGFETADGHFVNLHQDAVALKKCQK
jgi:hypothetical protein